MANKDYIGKIIGVKIDRELGSKHPKHGFIYPVNYGFIPNTISGDGEEIDCYVLGVFEPIKDFTGKYDIWMKTMTQVNGDVGDYKKRDYQIIRGGKSIAD